MTIVSYFLLCCLVNFSLVRAAPTTSASVSSVIPKASSTAKFNSAKAQNFLVQGSSLPEISALSPIDSYAGRVPLNGSSTDDKKLFFWMWPAAETEYSNNLIIYLNGGPGCSSMEAALQECGPYLKRPGTANWVKNTWSWNLYGNLLFVDQPVGTGYSQGTTDLTNEHMMARDFTAFLTQFLTIFPELTGAQVWLAGESYAGMYIPYISQWIRTQSNIDLQVKGIWLADPTTTSYTIQAQVPAAQFVRANNNLLGFDQAMLTEINRRETACGYDSYLEQNLVYPPTGLLPAPTASSGDCNIWSYVNNNALLRNPSFNKYHISDMSPGLSDNLSGRTNYLTQTAVRKALHVEDGVAWHECRSSSTAFVDGKDQSLQTGLRPSGVSISPLGAAIQASSRSVIVHGELDFIFQTNGTRLMLQNLTWSGLQGFQEPPVADSFYVPGQGYMGDVQTERNLTFVALKLAGHAVPQFQPAAALQLLKWMLGIIDDSALSSETSE